MCSALVRAGGASRSWSRLALAAALLVAATPAARSMTLVEALEAARAHDPQYRSAAYELEAARQGVPIARAALMPAVSLSYSNLGVSGTREFPNSLGQEVSTRVEYGSPNTTLALRMPLFNYDAWNRLDQATAQTKGAEAAYRVRGLELVDRVTMAYLQALEARAVQTLSETEVTSLTEQTRRAEQRLLRGEGTRTDEALSRASLEVARARLGDARNQVTLAATRLRRLTGRLPGFVFDAASDFIPSPSQADAHRDWIELALAQNPVLDIRKAAVEAARFGVRRNQAGHLPRVDLVANMAKSRNESLANLDQSSNLRSIGIQVNLPLFSGFGVQASVKQAESELARAEEDLRTERENNELEVRRLLNLADNAAARSAALRRAIQAGETAVQGATRSQEAGLGTLSEVLDATNRLYATRRELAQSQYDHLAARMRLMVLAGEPMQRVVEQIGAALVVHAELVLTQPTASPR